jgi:hypothetical protein
MEAGRRCRREMTNDEIRISKETGKPKDEIRVFLNFTQSGVGAYIGLHGFPPNKVGAANGRQHPTKLEIRAWIRGIRVEISRQQANNTGRSPFKDSTVVSPSPDALD